MLPAQLPQGRSNPVPNIAISMPERTLSAWKDPTQLDLLVLRWTSLTVILRAAKAARQPRKEGLCQQHSWMDARSARRSKQR